MSSQCGSADVLEHLGVKIDLAPEGVARCLREASIGFMFAPIFHPSMRFAGPVRREIGIRTVFNVLGPLTNPAGAGHQVLGVAKTTMTQRLARALQRLGTTHALVFHGDGGIDELSLSGPNLVFEVRQDEEPRQLIIDPAELGLERAPIDALKGGDVQTNAMIVRSILDGSERGPKRDAVLLNAAAALVAGDMATDMAAGLELARTSLDEGRALARLEQFIAVSQAA